MNKKITVLNYKKQLARGYIKGDDMHLLFDFPFMEQIKCNQQLGMNLLDFIWLDRSLVEDILSMIGLKYLSGCSVDELIDFIRPIADKNCYLMAYITYAIQLLADGALDSRFENDTDTDISYLDELYETYTTNDVKMLIIKQIPADIAEKQKKIEQDIELILGENSKYKDFSPAQRLYMMESEEKNYLTTSFNTSFSSEVDLRNLSKVELAEKIQKENIPFFEMFELKNLDDLIRFELVQMINHNCIVRRCKLCGKLFTPRGRSDSLFCVRRMNGEERPCIEIGPTRLQAVEINKNPILKTYKQAYDRMSSRKRYKTLSIKDFQKWQSEAGILRDKCLNGEMKINDYKAWLDQTKL